MTRNYRLHLPPIRREDAEGKARRLLDDAHDRQGFVPNMYANMVHSPALLETYLDGYRRFREHSGFTPAEQEVVFLTISLLHGCTYCVGAHSMVAVKTSNLDAETLRAICDGAPIEDPKLRAVAKLTEAMVITRGRPQAAQVTAFLDAGYGERQVLEIVLAIAVKTLSNYTNHLFETELDPVFARYAWQPTIGRSAA